jgi:hypothetical protein
MLGCTARVLLFVKHPATKQTNMCTYSYTLHACMRYWLVCCTSQVCARSAAEALRVLRQQRSSLASRQLPLPSLQEQPCIVNLMLWPFSTQSPARPLAAPLLQLPRTVLCSEMGASFSRCGRFLAVCVAPEHPSPQCEAWVTAQLRAPHMQCPASVRFCGILGKTMQTVEGVGGVYTKRICHLVVCGDQ